MSQIPMQNQAPIKKKYLASAAVVTTLGGAVAGATLLAPGLAGAQDDTDTPDAVEETVRPEAGEAISAALQGLVDDGTLTQAQLDAVVDTLVEARGDHVGRRGFRASHRGGGPLGGADLAEVLGLEPEAIREAIVGGQSLAEVAEAQGVDPQELVDAIVTATEERVNSAVEAGRIDQDRADEIVAGAAERAEDLVNGELEFEGRRGHRGPGSDVAPDAPAEADGDA